VWLGQAEKLTGLHIHRAAEGAAGPVVVNSGLRGPVDAAAGSGRWFYQANVEGAANIAVLRAIMANPAAYYCNLHSESNPGGIMRGQLENTAEWQSRMTRPVIDRLETFLRQIAFRLGISLN